MKQLSKPLHTFTTLPQILQKKKEFRCYSIVIAAISC